jgi:hypothetical protein
MKFRWNRTMLNLCGIVVAILKMVTGRNLSMSGINSGHNNLPTKFLPVAIFKMAATIPHKFNIVRFQRNFACRYIMMSWIDSRHQKISTGLHFQNGRHNTAKIQHCSISKVAFDLFTQLYHCKGFICRCIWFIPWLAIGIKFR